MTSKGRGLRPSPAMAVAFVSLFVALAGTAFSVGSKVPGKNGVKTSDLAPKAVKAGKLAGSAVTTGKLAANAVTTEKVAAGAVTGDKVAANTLSGAQISYGSHVVFAGNPAGADGATATCPPGEIATGGGADSADPADTLALLTSMPLPVAGPATSWRVFYQSVANANEIIAFAICMPA